MTIPNIGSVAVPAAVATPIDIAPVEPGGVQIPPAAAVVPPAAAAVPPAVPPAAPPVQEVSSIGASDPLPIPNGVPVQRSPQNTPPPEAAERQTPISDLNHVAANAPVFPPAPAAAQPEAPAPQPIPAPPVVSAPAEVAAAPASPEPDPPSTRVAGGTLPPPVVDLPADQAVSAPTSASVPQVAASVQKKADRYGIDISTVPGTGKGGKVTGRDIDAAIAAREAVAQTTAGAEAEAVAEAPAVEVVAEESSPAPAETPAVPPVPVTVPPAAPQPQPQAQPEPPVQPQPQPQPQPEPQPGPEPQLVTMAVRLPIPITVDSMDELHRIACRTLERVRVISVKLHIAESGASIVATVDPTVDAVL